MLNIKLYPLHMAQLTPVGFTANKAVNSLLGVWLQKEENDIMGS